MSNFTKLEFEALDISGSNYLSWALDAEFHLNATNLGETIKEKNVETTQTKAKAMILLRHHLHEDLKKEYLTVKDPQTLWNDLKERYDHQKTVILPKARYDWIHLRLQDYKSVTEYNSAMFRITSKMKLCGEKISDADMLEKTYSTFHASNLVLQTQYREKGYKKYSELISALLVAEQNNELLMKNHETRPTGSAPFPEANASYQKKANHANNSVHGRGTNRGRGYGRHERGRGRGYGYGRGQGRGVSFKNTNSHQKREHRNGNEQKTNGNVCYRCGGSGHWTRTCRTPKHLVELYQQALKGKGKNMETNLAFEDGEDDFGLSSIGLGPEDFGTDNFGNGGFDPMDTTALEVADFITPEGNKQP